MVHGVGGHDHLSNLLRTYQSFRANLTSVEAPSAFEDQIPGWRLARFEEAASPPHLRLEPIVDPGPGHVGAVCLYEVNYSGLAGVVRKNHPIDLTDLFLGLDLSVCEARERLRSGGSASASPVFDGDPRVLSAALQRICGVLTAGTVPIIGLPSIVFRDYIGTFVGVFTRFFEDVATFALDKNGEQLISAHLDQTLANISATRAPVDRLVIAAHSLGSVVVHNYVVRQAAGGGGPSPDTLITFGSPIGLLTWLWLFLDFTSMDFKHRELADGEGYFCWSPISRGQSPRRQLSWINVVNCLDPIATAFPLGACDLSASTATIAGGLKDSEVKHRFLGPAKITSIGAAHTQYLNDKQGFVAILLRAIGLGPGEPDALDGTRTGSQNWSECLRVLGTAQALLWIVAVVFIAVYCAIIGRRFGDMRVLWVVAVFAWPAVTIALFAAGQRLLLGGPTKRISPELIDRLSWRTLATFPYKLREKVRRVFGWSREIDPMAPSPGRPIRLVINAISFLPTLAAMAVPIVFAEWLTGNWPRPWTALTAVWSLDALLLLTCFMVYVLACAAFELLGAWRQVLRNLNRPQDVEQATAS